MNNLYITLPVVSKLEQDLTLTAPRKSLPALLYVQIILGLTITPVRQVSRVIINLKIVSHRSRALCMSE